MADLFKKENRQRTILSLDSQRTVSFIVLVVDVLGRLLGKRGQESKFLLVEDQSYK